MELMRLRVTHNAYFSLLTNTMQLLLVIFCDLTAVIIKWDQTGQDANNADDAVRTDRCEG